MIDLTAAESYILCELAGAMYGLPSRAVLHVEMVEQITPVPNTPPFVEGVAFTRGQVVPVVNLRRRFGFEWRPHDLRSRMVVVRSGQRTVGLLVDSAREFARIDAAAVRPRPEAIHGMSGEFLEGIATLGERMVLIVNVETLLQQPVALLPEQGNTV